MLNVNWVEILVYVHYNLWLLPHCCEEAKMDKSYNIWDNYREEDYLADGALDLENLETAPFDDDDCIETHPPISIFSPARTPNAGALCLTPFS